MCHVFKMSGCDGSQKGVGLEKVSTTAHYIAEVIKRSANGQPTCQTKFSDARTWSDTIYLANLL